MKAKQLFELSNEELQVKLKDMKAELFNLRFKHATNQLTNPMVLVNCKRDIARVNTILRERELNISSEPVKAAAKAKKAK